MLLSSFILAVIFNSFSSSLGYSVKKLYILVECVQHIKNFCQDICGKSEMRLSSHKANCPEKTWYTCYSDTTHPLGQVDDFDFLHQNVT
jgi:hypothetical protein